MRSTTPSSIILLALCAIPALSAPIQHTLAPRTENSLNWTDCSAYPWLRSKDLQCGNITVPVDWAAPSGETFTLRMVRLPRPANATRPRVGSLFINPGGPGGSGVTAVANIASGFEPVSEEILHSFDLIGVDPRGVQQSVESICDSAIWAERVSLFPKTQEEYDRLVDKNRRLGESCRAQMGSVVDHLDTISAARDHEAVRAALGEDMNWLGISYGSMLGAQYAQLFPGKIRTMVFDGVLQHSRSEWDNARIETTAYAASLRKFFDWAETNDESALKGRDVEKFWYELLAKARQTPIQNPWCNYTNIPPQFRDCREDVNEEDILFNTQGLLLTTRQQNRVFLAEALVKASQGNADDFASSLPMSFNPSLFAGITIGCQDWAPTDSSFEDLQAKMRMVEEAASLTKGASQTWTLQASCIGWPNAPKNPPAKLNIKTQDPILLVNSLRDPSTSYEWAVGMQDEIEKSVLLTRNGDGHTSWSLSGATRVAIDHYLITEELPAPGTVLDS
ncbi:TAP-like protein-domain-containing protein [Paraphoma chrysanthemicola]|uniref:TAP-like protein-domain-containing protein n=1 Tax=Paraphoma chrysanthemicola TaxID=798071 RepID=A0A8K0QZE4_9PLEO|nr:TAP-like protein-domain-containing protein [Paraphoma chrysanthemicola]